MVLCSNVNELLWGKRQTANYKNILLLNTASGHHLQETLLFVCPLKPTPDKNVGHFVTHVILETN